MARKTQKPSARAPKRKQPRADGLLHRAVSASGAAIARNPMMVGGTSAFLIAMFFVSANALWYQPHFHSGAFFATRDLPESTLPHPTDAGPAERTSNVPVPVAAPQDPVVYQVQSVLKDLKLYRGTLDGNYGQETADAVATYQKILSLPETGEIDDTLLSQLGITTSTASIAPVSVDTILAERAGPAAATTPADSGLPVNERVSRIQAGLRAFGNESVEIDGLMGAKTRSAIQEFQSLFGMAVTGEPDEELYAKMREIGLTD